MFFQGSSDRPVVLKYTLRMNAAFYDSLDFCFNPIQNQLERSFIQTFSPDSIPEITLGTFNYFRTLEDAMNDILKFLLPLVLIITTFYTANNIIKVST